jgi:predicted SAM-dependent methyltransferase
LDARQFNVLTEEFTDQYDLIFADAVFEHFTPEELAVVISKIHQAIKEGGTLGFSVRRGDGEYWSDEKLDEKRYFRLWQPTGLTELLSSAGFTVDSIA